MFRAVLNIYKKCCGFAVQFGCQKWDLLRGVRLLFHWVCKRFVKYAVLELAKKSLEEESMNLGFLEGANVTAKSNNLVVAVHHCGSFIYTQEHFFRGHRCGFSF
jgi:hypothetical protein